MNDQMLQSQLLMLWGRTGRCDIGQHDRCMAGPPGISLTQGPMYVCSCPCHDEGVSA